MAVCSFDSSRSMGRAAFGCTAPQDDPQLDQQIKAIASAHHGHIALYAHNLRTGQTASLLPDEPVQTASVIKMGILLDAAEQIRAAHATLDERIVKLAKANQVEGSGVLGATDHRRSPSPWAIPSG